MLERTRAETSPLPTVRTARTARTAAKPRRRSLGVLSVPAHHPYVATVTPASARPVAPHRTVGWEPDPIFVPGAISARALDIDLVHLHFSFDHLDVPTTRAWLTELHDHRIPLVITAHDLRNPHHDTRGHHDELLAELMPAAAAVITLTSGAAREIAERYGVSARIVPHPTLADPTLTADVTTEAGLTILHLKSLRRNLIDPLALVAAAASGAADAGGRLRVDVHPAALDDPGLIGLDRVPGVELAVHPRYDDLALERYVRRAHVTVLPYRWGTHSGWLELARDLGTRVVAPDCGYYRDQWSDVVSYTNNEASGFDPASLREAVANALSRPPLPPAERSVRLAEATAVRRTHEALYRRLVR